MRKNLFTAVLIGALFIGCGGGGGGSNNQAQFVHAALEQPPLRLVTDDEAAAGAAFAEVTEPIGISEGEYAYQVVQQFGAGAFAQGLTEVAANEHVLLIAIDNAENPLKVLKTQRDELVFDEGAAAVRIVNAVSGTSNLRVQIGPSGALERSLAFGAASAYINIEAGDHEIVARSDNNQALLRSTASFMPGSSYTVVIMGEAGLFVVGRVVN